MIIAEKNVLDNKPHWYRLIAGEPTALPRGVAISHSPPPTSARNSPVPSVQSVSLATPPLSTPPVVTPPPAQPPVSAIKDSSKPVKKTAKVVIKSDKSEKSVKSTKSEKNSSKNTKSSSKSGKSEKSKKDAKKSK